jgi:hypothetical protein
MANISLLPNRTAETEERTRLTGWSVGVLRAILLLLSAGFVIAYIVVACLRMGYPYELEWIEGGIVDHIRWILSGRGIYVEPSLEFVPNYYTPLYLYLGAGLCKVMGVGFLPLRLISFVSSLGCFWMIGRLVRRETGSWTWAIVSAGLFAASYRMTGAWMDIARIDSLFLFLALAAAYLVNVRRDTTGLIVAGLLMALSFLTKQSALVIAGPLMLFTLLANQGWSRVAFAGTFVGLVAGTTLLFDAFTDGLYSRYILGLPNQHRYIQAVWVTFWTQDIGRNLAVAATMAFLAVSLGGRRHGGRDRLFYAMLLAGMMGTAWLSRLHEGGYDNVLMPAAAVLAIGFGLGAGRLQSALQGASVADVVHACNGPDLRKALLGAMYLAGIWQFVLLAYLPDRQVPRKADRRAGDAMIDTLTKLDGDVLMLEHGFLHTLAGRDTFHAQAGALWAVVQGTDKKMTDDLLDGFRRAIRDRRYDVLVLDELPDGGTGCVREFAVTHGLDARQVKGPSFLELLRRDIEDHYERIGSLFQRSDVHWPVTGVPVRPNQVYVRKDKAAGLSLPGWPVTPVVSGRAAGNKPVPAPYPARGTAGCATAAAPVHFRSETSDVSLCCAYYQASRTPQVVVGQCAWPVGKETDYAIVAADRIAGRADSAGDPLRNQRLRQAHGSRRHAEAHGGRRPAAGGGPVRPDGDR